MSKDTPQGLPPIPEGVAAGRAIDKLRRCPTCSSELRIVSNYLGVNGHCGPCKRHWPIAMTQMSPVVPQTPVRGLHKQTQVEPNWDIAFDEIGDDTDEQVRERQTPKPKKG